MASANGRRYFSRMLIDDVPRFSRTRLLQFFPETDGRPFDAALGLGDEIDDYRNR